MSANAQHLHTYFLFPFSIDKEGVRETHGHIWKDDTRWIDGLDEWIASHPAPYLDMVWKRTPYTQFDLNSRAYQDMIFFHPIVRRVFFDTTGQEGSREALLRCYTMQPPIGGKLFYEVEDNKGGKASVEITDLRLFLFANGIGILSLGVEAWNIPIKHALWINETMRKVYPSSARQIREGRSPSRSALVLDQKGTRTRLAEETAETGVMKSFQPPLSRTIKSLIYFAEYGKQEFEPVLDERMIVYTYLEIDPGSVPAGYKDSEEYQILLSRVLYVEHDGDEYRYEVNFLRERMDEHLYRRWAHQGTYYGFTSYSNVSVAIGQFDCGGHQLSEGFLIHRMFDTRYYLMALVSLFYRATLLDFGERTALVSRRLYESEAHLTPDSVLATNHLRTEFLHFSNYWHFDELANKEEELEHFELQSRFYRITAMKQEINDEVESLGAAIQEHYQFRNTEAINRVAMLSLILGIGAMITGFFGMNFGRGFAQTLFEPTGDFPLIHLSAVAFVILLALGVLLFSVYVVVVNWEDYRDILDPHGKKVRARSLRRDHQS
ncbi:MAG: CorA family divalent cation transporter [Bryobacteraceae bacterium]